MGENERNSTMKEMQIQTKSCSCETYLFRLSVSRGCSCWGCVQSGCSAPWFWRHRWCLVPVHSTPQRQASCQSCSCSTSLPGLTTVHSGACTARGTTGSSLPLQSRVSRSPAGCLLWPQSWSPQEQRGDLEGQYSRSMEGNRDSVELLDVADNETSIETALGLCLVPRYYSGLPEEGRECWDPLGSSLFHHCLCKCSWVEKSLQPRQRWHFQQQISPRSCLTTACFKLLRQVEKIKLKRSWTTWPRVAVWSVAIFF